MSDIEQTITYCCNPGENMYCPVCGKELIEIERTDELERISKLRFWNILFKPVNPDLSTHFKCDNCKSFGEDYPLIMHYPGGDLKSCPGDSWSLSWVK